MKLATSVVLVALFGVWLTQACSCLNSPFCPKFERSSDVIRGRVTAQQPNGQFSISFSVNVIAVFKGALTAGSSIAVSTASNSAACGVSFQIGQEYLIFLNGLSTNLCAGNQLWSSVTAVQLLFLRNPQPCGTCAAITCLKGSPCQVDELGVASCTPSCNLRCPIGQVCKLQPVVCVRYPCPPQPTCVDPCADKVCGDFQKCTIYNGQAYCVDSCEHRPCPEGQFCQMEDVLCIQAPCFPQAVCVNPCADVSCGRFQTCKVENGQAYCADVCEGRPCPTGAHCELQEVQCVRAPCPPVAVCVDRCAETVCADFQECRVTETGEAYCADSCAHWPCPTGQVCKLEQVVCVRAPCPPHAVCVADPCAAIRCDGGRVCKITDDGEAYCADTCEGHECPAGAHCELQPVTCIRYPCPPVAACVSGCDNKQCGPYQDCKIWEPTGEAYCADTCENRPCPVPSQRCSLVQVQCVRAPCPPVAECVCPQACPAVYRPVCGSNGKTYGNSCELGVANCELLSNDPDARPITQVSEGACPVRGCEVMRCARGYVCVEDKEGNGRCVPTCDTYDCPAGQVCDLVAPEVCTASLRPCLPAPTCIACPQACNKMYAPVCGNDGNTYGNKCELQRHNCGLPADARRVTIAHEGECCPEACAEIYQPVCGTDGVTYSNECDLRRITCGKNPRVDVAHAGEC